MPLDLAAKLKIGLVGILVLGVLFMFVGPVYTVDAGERGVLLTWGKVSSGAIGPGLHFKIPVVQSVAKFNVQTQKYDADATAASKDLQTVHTTIAVIHHLRPESVPTIYSDLGYSYGDRVIQPLVQEVVKASTAKYFADELITRRADVASVIQNTLKERLAPYGILVESTAITNFDFSKSFSDAIEAKVTATQQKQKAEMDLQRVKVEADMKVAQAEAEAKALKMQREAITPDLIELRKIEVQKVAVDKWNGQLPTYVGSDAIPFIGVGGKLTA